MDLPQGSNRQDSTSNTSSSCVSLECFLLFHREMSRQEFSGFISTERKRSHLIKTGEISVDVSDGARFHFGGATNKSKGRTDVYIYCRPLV